MKKLIVFALVAILVVSMSALFVNAAETNVAAGKSYTFTGAAENGDYPDTGNKELTDGVKGALSDIGYQSAIWTGLNWKGIGAVCADTTWSATTIAINEIVVDLGSVTEGLTRFAVTTQDCGSGINKPKKIEVMISNDKTNFTSLGNTTSTKTVDKANAEFPDYGIYEYSYTASAEQSARYVKFVVTHGNAWTFISEVEVFTGGSTVDPVSEDETTDDPASTDESDDESKSAESVADTSAAVSAESKAASTDESKDDEDGLSPAIIAAIIAGAIVVIGGGVYFATKKK